MKASLRQQDVFTLLKAGGLSTVVGDTLLHFLANKPSLSFTYCPAGSTLDLVSSVEPASVSERRDVEHRPKLSKSSAIEMTSDEVLSSILN